MWFNNKPSILLIDDDPSIQMVTHARLTKVDNYTVKQALNGKEGLSKALDYTPDIILLDWNLPGMNGLDVLAQLKIDPKSAHIPVLMLTGKNLIGEIEQAFSTGADAYLTKPLDLKKLSQRISSLLKLNK